MKYQNITTNDMLNGEGLRVVLWVSGCSHHCQGCQNSLTWDPDDGLEFDDAAKEEIFAELEHDYIQGLTLSGGDPLYVGNRKAVIAFAKEVKEKFPDKDIWMYTGFSMGDAMEDLTWDEIMQNIDVLVDGKFEESLKENNLHWVGSSNQRIIRVNREQKKILIDTYVI